MDEEPYCPSPSQKPSTSSKAKGKCSVCFKTRKLHDKDGKVHLHGPMIERCKGSKKPPSLTIDAFNATHTKHGQIFTASSGVSHMPPGNTFNVNTQGVPTAGDSFQDPPFSHPQLQQGLLRHIPKGARTCAARLLTKIINNITQDPNAINRWQSLLSFGALVLERPSRGGKRRNLTEMVKKRASDVSFQDQATADNLFTSEPGFEIHRNAGSDQTRSLAAAVAAKLEDGNVKAAARILCSADTPAPTSTETWAELCLKHPTPPPKPNAMPPPPEVDPYQATEKEIWDSIRSLPSGSAGGPDGLRPQHVLEMVNTAGVGQELVTAVTTMINLMLAGKCPPEVRATLFGGSLFALRKPAGGLRPIVVGYYWRRLASKRANAYAVSRMAPLLTPHQLGVGTSGGCEAAVHATRRFLSNMAQDSIMVKLDIDAFNCLDRVHMLTT